MKRLTIGLVVIGLLLVCSQSFGIVEIPLTTGWALPPTSEWQLQSSGYIDDGDFTEVYICSDMRIFTYTAPGKSEWYCIRIDMGESIFVYEDDDYDGLWTLRIVYK